jgi:type IV pilus assembly protein PilP
MLAAAALVALALAGCGDDVTDVRGAGGPATGDGTGTGPGLAAPPDGGVDGAATPVTLNFRDEDFVESPQNRDPFRSYARLFKVRPPESAQRRVIMPTTGLDEMTLIAIVSGTSDARAMFTDPAGIGYVLQRGDYVGRPEVVQTGGDQGMAVTLNWRVDRIRPDSVVLVREDPTAPGNPPLTRVIPLHTPDETPNIAASGQGVQVVGQGDGTGAGGPVGGSGTGLPLPSDLLGQTRRDNPGGI